MADETILKVTRESLSSGIIRKMAVERNDGDVQIASDDELLVSRRTLVPDNADCEDIWIFGYGSLIFNPVSLCGARQGGFRSSPAVLPVDKPWPRLPTVPALCLRWTAAAAVPALPSGEPGDGGRGTRPAVAARNDHLAYRASG